MFSSERSNYDSQHAHRNIDYKNLYFNYHSLNLNNKNKHAKFNLLSTFNWTHYNFFMVVAHYGLVTVAPAHVLVNLVT